MVCYSSTQSWYIIKINGTSFTATATKILGLEGGNTQKFKTLSLSLGQKGYNSLSFWKKNNFFKKSFNFCTVPQVSKHWFSQTYLNNKNTPALLYSVTSCRRITAAICIIVAEQGNVPSSKVQPDLDTIEEKLINTKMLLKGVSTCFLYLSVLTFQVPQKNGFVSQFTSISAPQWGSTTSELSGKKTRLCVAVLVLGCPLKSNCEQCAWSLRTSVP